MTEIQNQVGRLERTQDGTFTLVHPIHGESYHSSCGALRESNELYLGGSGFSSEVKNGQSLTVLDVGLGLGYNALATIEAWLDVDLAGDLTLVSLESDRSLVEQLTSGAASWQESWTQSWLDMAQLLEPSDESGMWRGSLPHPNGTAHLKWVLFVGSALDNAWLRWLRQNSAPLNFVWQDAFSPKVCPELWTPGWFAMVGSATRPNCKLMTYSVARTVRDALSAAGWNPQRIPGTNTKRHWLMAEFSTIGTENA